MQNSNSKIFMYMYIYMYLHTYTRKIHVHLLSNKHYIIHVDIKYVTFASSKSFSAFIRISCSVENLEWNSSSCKMDVCTIDTWQIELC